MQLRRKPIGATLAAATCSLLGTLPAAPAAAQEAKDWSIDTSLLYYGEDNGRVEDVSLMASIRRAFDEDHSLSATLTVDSLTGATPSGAVPANAPQTFTGPSGGGSYTISPGEQPLDTTFLDTRVALGASWQQSLGDAMRWSVGFSGSDEYDYLHLGLDARLERDFNLRNTTAFIGLAYGQDEIKPVGGIPAGLTAMLGEVEDDDGDDSGAIRGRDADDSKDVADLLVGVTQVLSRRSLLEVAFSYSQSDGYLTDPYKILSVVDPVTGVPVAGPAGGVPFLYLYEERPDSRTKQSLFAEWRYALDRDSFALNFRYMDDDWGVTSQTAEARYRWNINDHSYLEPHLRWYTQSAADFYRTVLFTGDPLPESASADYRLADLDAYTIGAKYGLRTDHGEFSVRLEYYQQSPTESPGSAVGDLAGFDLTPDMKAVIVQFGYQFDF
jgi:Protein of unknown function (DUF3570)